MASLVVLAFHLWRGEGWTLAGVFAVDGLTVVMWVVVTLLSGVVHSYSRRYMAGSRNCSAFFGRLFLFTLVVAVLVAADHLVAFALAWLAMGLVMASLVGHVDGWPQAQAAGALARRYFLASSLLLGLALLSFYAATGATTISTLSEAVGDTSGLLLVGIAALVLAALVQSALVPFHTWLLSSMTAPTPASALMHAGFVNAGGILLARFAPVVALEAAVMLAIVVVGATSAILGKFLKTVQPSVKGQLGCSTVGQMGFMVMQAGLGFFTAAVAHLVLHGFYKAYLFLSSGSRVEQTSPSTEHHGAFGVVGMAVIAATALAGGAIFAGLTGRGTSLDSGLVLAILVVVMTMHAAQLVVRRQSLPSLARYGAVPLVFLPAIAVYGTVYNAITHLMADLPAVVAPVELGPVHIAVTATFIAAFVALETGVYRRSQRLYAALVNVTEPPKTTVVTTPEEYNEY